MSRVFVALLSKTSTTKKKKKEIPKLKKTFCLRLKRVMESHLQMGRQFSFGAPPFPAVTLLAFGLNKLGWKKIREI